MPELFLGWQFDPVLIGGIVTLATLFALATGPLRSRLAPGRPYPTGRALLFYGALALLYLLEGSPLHDLAERYSFTAHMVQHMGVSYVVAPMILAAVPIWVWRPLLLTRGLAPISAVLLHPLVAFGTFTFFFSAWHVPVIYDGSLQNATAHHAQHLAFLFVSIMLWWPLMSRVPERPRLGHLLSLVYLFLLPVFQLPVFGSITFADHVLYATYANAPWTLGMSAIAEQTLAGAVMKLGGFAAFGIPFVVIFFRWYQEEAGDRPRSFEPKPRATAVPAEPT
ncbi:MAG: cytochrome c oxidase assembly protein [Trueperaceae bacterium]